LKVGGHQRNILFEIWVVNTFNAWQKYKKLNTSMLIVNLHCFEPKLFVNYLPKQLLQIATKMGNFIPQLGLNLESLFFQIDQVD
jgi:hypothetical protein